MNCPICGKKMKRIQIPNPFGVARTDLYVCTKCENGMYFGSQDLLDKFKTVNTALSVAISSLKSIQQTEAVLGFMTDDALKELKQIVVPEKGKKHAKKSN